MSHHHCKQFRTKERGITAGIIILDERTYYQPPLGPAKPPDVYRQKVQLEPIINHIFTEQKLEGRKTNSDLYFPVIDQTK